MLEKSVLLNNDDITKLLILNGAKVDHAQSGHFSPFYQSIVNNKFEIVALMLATSTNSEMIDNLKPDVLDILNSNAKKIAECYSNIVMSIRDTPEMKSFAPYLNSKLKNENNQFQRFISIVSNARTEPHLESNPMVTAKDRIKPK